MRNHHKNIHVETVSNVRKNLQYLDMGMFVHILSGRRIMEEVLLKTKSKLKKPKLYSVIIYNDDVTPMDFVVNILNRIFDKSLDEATKLMLEVHQKGSTVVGIYIWDIANTKKNQADMIAIDHGYPLKLSLEEYMDN